MEFFSFFLERNWSAEYKKKGKGRGGKYLEKRNIWSTGRGGRKTDEENILIFSLKAKYNIWSAEEEKDIGEGKCHACDNRGRGI